MNKPENPKAAPSVPGPAASLWRGPTELMLQQSQAWLRLMEDAYRAQINATHLAVNRVDEMRKRLQQPGTGDAASGLPLELLQFQGACSLRLAQELTEIGVRGAAEFGGLMADAGVHAMPALPTTFDPSLPLSLFHTGVRPMDDLFGAALNRLLMPNTAA